MGNELTRRTFLCATTASGLLLPPTDIITELRERPDAIVEGSANFAPKQKGFLLAVRDPYLGLDFSIEGNDWNTIEVRQEFEGVSLYDGVDFRGYKQYIRRIVPHPRMTLILAPGAGPVIYTDYSGK